MVRWLRFAPLVALVVGLAIGCGGPPAGGPAPPTTAKVTAAKVILKDNIDFEDFTGRTVPVESVDVRPQVTATIVKVFFKDGDEVKTGDKLYQLDDRTFLAEVDQIKSNIASAQARLEQFSADLGRARRMRIGEAISREDYDKIAANKDDAQATLNANQAKLKVARTNLTYTSIVADIDGEISKTNLTVGNLATANQSVLTNIVSTATIRAEFDVDERTALRVGQRIRDGKFKNYKDANLPVFLGNQLDQDYPYEGVIDFVENRLNPSTGTLLVRGLFPNMVDKLPKGKQPLKPGLFVRIRVPMGQVTSALMVSEQALVPDQDRYFVYVVGADKKVQARRVTIGGMRDGLRVITEGLKKDELVVLSGLQRLRPGSEVEATVQEMPTASGLDLPAGLSPEPSKK